MAFDESNGIEAGLLDAIYREPANDHLRRVYADWLLSRSDPRGEFIALQYQKLKARLSPAEERRELQLCAAHAGRWLGRLAPMLGLSEGTPLHQANQEIRFGRGFLTEVGTTPNPAPTWNAAPEWATVERLWGGSSSFGVLLEAPLRSLKRLDVRLTEAFVTRLANQGRVLTATAVMLDAPISDWARVRRVFPLLEELTLGWEELPSIDEVVHLGTQLIIRKLVITSIGPQFGYRRNAGMDRYAERLSRMPLPFAEVSIVLHPAPLHTIDLKFNRP